MADTNIPAGSPLAVKEFSVALFAGAQRIPSFMSNMLGPAPKASDAAAKLRHQTGPGMPFVRVVDLARAAGDVVTMDLINVVYGKPIMGDRMKSGKGAPMSLSTMEGRIDLAGFPIAAVSKMAQQRTKHDLRMLALAQGQGYMARLESQMCLVHTAGARGSQNSVLWCVPLQSDPDFTEIVINPVRAPTYNRHFVANGANITQGGQQLGSIVSTDTLRLSHIDQLAAYNADLDFKLQPVQIPDDPAAADAPMYVLWCPQRSFEALKADVTANYNIRAAQQQAWNRASYGSKHPLFKGDPFMWNNILVKPMDYAVRFLPGDTTKIVTAANAATATETDQVVNAGLTAGYGVDRCLLLGAQGLGCLYGAGPTSNYAYGWAEEWTNFHQRLEILTDVMSGKVKTRFSIPDASGTAIPTDHGVIVLDVAVKL